MAGPWLYVAATAVTEPAASINPSISSCWVVFSWIDEPASTDCSSPCSLMPLLAVRLSWPGVAGVSAPLPVASTTSELSELTVSFPPVITLSLRAACRLPPRLTAVPLSLTPMPPTTRSPEMRSSPIPAVIHAGVPVAERVAPA